MGTRCAIAIVGAGNVARRHASVLAGFSDVRLVGVTDVVPDAAGALAAEYGALAYPDVAAVVDAEPDAVYVCVPPFAHGPAEEAVLAAGLPMFVEKPLAVDLATAERIAPLAERVVTAVGLHWRYLDAVERARALLAGREVRLVTGSWLDKVPPVDWWVRRESSGGPVVEQAPHVLDVMRLLAGEVAQVHAVGGGRPAVEGADVDAATAAMLRFESGAPGTLTTTCVLGWKHRASVEVFADGLAISVGEDGLLVRDGEAEHRYPGDPAAARVAVDRAFVDAVLGVADDVRVPYAEALRTHRLAAAVARSAVIGEAVGV
ncbi:Gfo/Idh/MocA family protein [Phytohabitans houttuyneae]|uniref:Gfo/Idh/MocA family protein n=1 Tax=Phytohabitans houttuyneae TaxID=1076126 RepID=UPI00156411B8|nr:Gfo/Idh/MocA family oxidoreductase [Phytohabitans houttuyneae]